MTSRSPPPPFRWSDAGAFALLLLAAVFALVPLSPGLPADHLDAGWIYGMNQAMAQGAAIGRDLVFTFGPYASVYTRSYHPATDALMLTGTGFLALCFALSSALLVRHRPRWQFFAYVATMLVFAPYPQDVWFFAMPLVAALAIVTADQPDGRRGLATPLPLGLIALLMSPLGLLPLVKGSNLVMCGATSLLCAAYFWRQRQRRRAVVCVAAPALALPLFWALAGQPMAALPSFFANLGAIIAGYTEAMAFPGKVSEIFNFLLIAGAVFVAIAFQKARGSYRLFLLALFGVFLFIAYKGGFVRHDGHAMLASGAMLVAALLVGLLFSSGSMAVVALAAFVSWVNIGSHYFSPGAAWAAARNAWLSPGHGLVQRLSGGHWPRAVFDAVVADMQRKAALPRLPGTSDIYSYRQSALIASGNTWNFRPVIQSYSAYTAGLAEMNRQHLLGARAPDNVFFRVEPIDERLPSLEDGASWPALLSAYRPTAMLDEHLLLQRRPPPAAGNEQPIGEVTRHAFDTAVAVPQADGPVYARLDIEPSLLGRLVGLLYKPSRLQIEVELAQGERKRFRLIAGMAKSTFMISPLVENTTEFGLLFAGGSPLAGKQVKSFKVSTVDEKLPVWKPSFAVSFTRQAGPAEHVDMAMLVNFDRRIDDALTQQAGTAAQCAGYIDFVNDTTPPPALVQAGASLKVSGWAAATLEPAALPEAVYLVLQDESGRRTFFQTRRVPRPDVAAHFKKPELTQSGYAATVDVSQFSGKYTLGLAQKVAGRIEICPQFRIVTQLSGVRRSPTP